MKKSIIAAFILANFASAAGAADNLPKAYSEALNSIAPEVAKWSAVGGGVYLGVVPGGKTYTVHSSSAAGLLIEDLRSEYQSEMTRLSQSVKRSDVSSAKLDSLAHQITQLSLVLGSQTAASDVQKSYTYGVLPTVCGASFRAQATLRPIGSWTWASEMISGTGPNFGPWQPAILQGWVQVDASSGGIWDYKAITLPATEPYPVAFASHTGAASAPECGLMARMFVSAQCVGGSWEFASIQVMNSCENEARGIAPEVWIN